MDTGAWQVTVCGVPRVRHDWATKHTQSLSFCPILCNPMNCSAPGFPVLHYLPEFAQIHVHWVGDAIQPSHPLSSPSPPALNLSHHQGLFHWVNSSHQVAKVLELQHQCFQWIFGLMSFRMDWLDLLAVQGTLKSLLQHHSSKASILRCSAFFMVQLTYVHDYWKNSLKKFEDLLLILALETDQGCTW